MIKNPKYMSPFQLKVIEVAQQGPEYNEEEEEAGGFTTRDLMLGQHGDLAKLSAEDLVFFVNTYVRLTPLHIFQAKYGEKEHGWKDSSAYEWSDIFDHLCPPWVGDSDDEDVAAAVKMFWKGRWRLEIQDGFFVWVLATEYHSAAGMLPAKSWHCGWNG